MQTVDGATLNQWEIEAMKVAALGVTITVSTGDNGAPGYTPQNGCLCDMGSSSSISDWQGGTTWTGVGYFPSFPATSAWVTAVGGTQGPEDGNDEIACQSQEGGECDYFTYK